MGAMRDSFIETLRDSYSAYYDLYENDGLTELPLAFRGDFSSRGEKYWLVKSVKIWGNETRELVYIFSGESFDESTVKSCVQFVIDDAQPRVEPHKEHNYTNFHAIFVAEHWDRDALKAVKASKYDKSYNHSLWGFSMLKAAAVGLEERKVWTNGAGHDLKSFYRKLFARQAKADKANGK